MDGLMDDAIPEEATEAYKKSGPATIGDLSIGDWITILEWTEEVSQGLFGYGSSVNRSGVGYSMQVKAINAPFIVAYLLSGENWTLDSRIVKLMHVTNEFREAQRARGQNG